MYCVNGNSSWYINYRPLFGGCPLFGVSVIGGSTVFTALFSKSLAKVLALRLSKNVGRICNNDNHVLSHALTHE